MRRLRDKLGSDFDVAVGALALALTFFVMIFVASGKFGDLVRGGGRTLKVQFANVQQLRASGFMHNPSDVRIDGLSVGHVSSVALDPGARTATATLSLQSSAGPVYADATAALRWQSLLGADFYVAIDRGSPSAGLLGSRPIPAEHTSNQVELEDITSVIQGGARAGLEAMPSELATALSDPHSLPHALSTLARIAPAATVALRAVQGQEPASDVQTLISSTGAALHAVDRPNDQLGQLVAGAAATLGTTGDNQAALASTIAQAPAALDSTQLTLHQLDGTLALADPLIAELQGPAPRVAPTLAALHPTVVQANSLLRHAVPLLRALRPTAQSLQITANLALPLLGRLTPVLDRVNGNVLPYLNEVDPSTGRTTAEMIGPGIAVYANAGGSVDTQGRMFRFPLSLGSSPAYLPCQTYLNNPDAAQTVACQTLQQALQSVLSYTSSPTGAAAALRQSSGGRP
jgi:phospholipid/cholesterol/gamma-HCH transport system substrate-binding protein